MELLRPFVPTQLTAMESETVTTMATVARWANRGVTIDGSAAVANGILLKFEREFGSEIPFEAVADRLMKDERELLATIGVKEDDRP
jgi:hypothetical protein